VQVDGLLEEAVEEFGGGDGAAPIERESELVEVGIRVIHVHVAAIEERGATRGLASA
jgi:hypothetical protein